MTRPQHHIAALIAVGVMVVAWPATRFGSAAEVDGIRVEKVASPIDVSCRGIAAVSADEVWVAGAKGTVIRTKNAGKSWQRIDVPDSKELDFRDIDVLPDGTVILMSAGSGAASRVYRSDDDGQSWQLVLQNRAEKGFFNGFEFDGSNRTAILFGDPLDGRLDMYMTTDKGKTWKPWPRDERPKLSEGEYGFAASGTGLAFTRSYLWIATGGSQANVWRTLRSFANWERLATPIRSGEASAGIFSICMTDDDRGVVIGGDYLHPELATNNVAFTIDGKTWQANESQKMPHKACVRALGRELFLAVGRTGVAFSADGGRAWQHVSDDSFYTLSVTRDKKYAWAAGADGQVARILLSR